MASAALYWILFVISSGCHALTRDQFPRDFIFGASTSAYQVEGAANIDGRKPSIWDTFTHAEKIVDGSNGDIACDEYHHYKEDVAIMKKMGLTAYRFSISWSRLIPDGRGSINLKGLEYYNNLIDELIIHGIQPHVTLFHFETPQALEDAYKGWLHPNIIKDFVEYANVCFREFGDRVKYWNTINEVNAMGILSYDYGLWPPQRCSYPFGNCTAGNSSVEPYLISHHMLLAHAKAVKLYRLKYQRTQKGSIGMSYYAPWMEPYSNSSDDKIAAQRGLEFYVGWLLEPLISGDYPQIVKENAGSRLPLFTKQQSKMLKGSFDFLGIMHYTTFLIKDASEFWLEKDRDYYKDMGIQILVERSGVPFVKLSPIGFPIAPEGMEKVLEYLKRHYNNPPLIIYENGYASKPMLVEEELQDEDRSNYIHDYLDSLANALRNGSNTKGYFVWSLVDGFDLFNGYEVRYGLLFVDFKDVQRTRKLKNSAIWYSKFLNSSKEDFVNNSFTPFTHIATT